MLLSPLDTEVLIGGAHVPQSADCILRGFSTRLGHGCLVELVEQPILPQSLKRVEASGALRSDFPLFRVEVPTVELLRSNTNIFRRAWMAQDNQGP